MLTDTIKADMQNAMKARDSLRLSVLRGAMSAFTNELVAQNKKPIDRLEDEGAIKVLKRLAKQRKDSAEQFKIGNRNELAEKELAELKIIEEYLPQTTSVEEIEEIAKLKIEEFGSDKTKMGIIIGAVMKEFGGNADGNDVKDVVVRLL